ncbi:ethanolamine ammonia-lyase subunit EutC [Gluconacetobacter sacchari]|uniref:Ethanolamine ammonia-lyase small subunit n=2 Tax=Gluconacetobacter sacchari TaxID=92759 RepID=A0A7W4NS30_9PROT|nr:ethanolamine ammonia-lyase subunit EutC [Gluconacetobacter sacchari]MBB2160800.1 ethanolamine ammonia-lyase subunit EutC [Gluconacetobacter sacchari]GBQ28076.1 ethanolamine ammonia-lyase small subunit [Gluconacetobacter sacchari DSM 12717]
MPVTEARAPDLARDPWATLRGLTHARIGLGRAGDALAGADVRALQAAHAQARRAVHATLDPARLALGAPFIAVRSRAPDRGVFVRRPDLGRRLAAPDAERLPCAPCDVLFVIADGLSALAAARQAPGVLEAARAALPGWSIGPVIVAHNARVALGDEIGERIGARCVVMMIGERPGLSAADSLSLYLTWDPKVGRMDSERNCISNIHAHGGMDHDEAAFRLGWLLRGARALGRSGISLKDDSMSARLPPAAP